MSVYSQYAFARTVGQSSNPTWWSARRGRITSSIFKKVVTAKKPSAIKRCVDQILNPQPNTWVPAACQMGIAEEGNAKEAYERLCRRRGQNITLLDSGICISTEHPWLAASPDGFVQDSEGHIKLLEIKCIHDTSATPRLIMDIAKNRSQFYCRIVDGDKLELKKSHGYYYQCMGQMALSGIKDLDFVIYAPRTGEIIVQTLKFEPEEWAVIFNKLDEFKQRYFVPHDQATDK